MAEGETEVDELLKQLRGAKQRELRLRAEKERVRLEIDQLRGDPLWAREQQAQKELEGVRRAKEQLMTQQQQEAKSLEQLNQNLRAKEIDWRRESMSFKTDRADPARRGSRRELIRQRSSYKTGLSPVRDGSTEEADALQSLVRKIDCDEQQRKVARLQTELQNANARRRSDEHLEPTQLSNEVGSILGGTRAKSQSSARISQDQIGDESKPSANFLGSFNKSTARSSSVKSSRSSTTPFPKSPNGMLMKQTDAPAPLMPSQPLLQPLPCTTSIPSIYIAPTFPFMIPSYPTGHSGFCSPIGVSYHSSPLQPIQQYSATMPLHWPTAQDPYAFYSITNPVGISSPLVPLMGSVQPGQERAAIFQLERQIEVLKGRLGSCSNDTEVEQLQQRVGQLRRKVLELTGESCTSDVVTTINRKEEEQSFGDDHVLTSLKREHLEAITKIRNERDLLEEQEKLDEFKEDISRRRNEKKRERDHAEWIARQKRELVELRLQRSRGHKYSALDAPDVDSDGAIPESYTPDVGLTVFWDDIIGIPAAPGNLQITYAVFEGTILRTSFRAIPAKDVEAIGPTTKRFIFRSSRHITKLLPSRELRILMEVSSLPTEQQGARNGALSSIGWSVAELFVANSDTVEPLLVAGFFKLPIQKPPMPDPSKMSIVDLPPVDDGGPFIRIRVAFGNKADDEAHLGINPQLHSDRYRIPDTTKNIKVGLLDSPDHKRSIYPPDVSRGNKNGSGAHADNQGNKKGRPSVESPQPIQTSNHISGSTIASNEPIQSVDDSWIRVDKRSETKNSAPGSEIFDAGNGFDVAIDGARCLPDNTTITKVTLAALNADRSQIETTDGVGFLIPVSNVFDPIFDVYVEYRQPRFNPTLTLVIRVDTVDLYSKLPVILGYCVFPVFFDIETQNQPLTPEVERIRLNEGGFQIPLRSDVNLGAPDQQFSAKAVDQFPIVPCATLLVRLIRAKRTSDGVLMSRKKCPPDQWESKGLLNPRPHYHDKVYDSMGCIPTQVEHQIYALRSDQRKPRLESESRQQLASLSIPDVNAILKAKPKAFLDLKSAFKYQPTIGFRVSIDGLHNVKSKPGSFFKVLWSIFPPGAFYQTPRVTAGVHFTTTINWDSAQASPEFKEEWMNMRDYSSETQPLTLVLDIKAINRDQKSGEFSFQTLGWTFTPILSEVGSIAIGSLQLPLLQGEVQLDILQRADSAASMTAMMEAIGGSAKSVPVTFLDGASLFVRLEDPQVPSISTQPMVNTTPSRMLPRKQVAKYAYDATKVGNLKRKAPMSKLLPPSATAIEFEKELNAALIKEMGLQASAL